MYKMYDTNKKALVRSILIGVMAFAGLVVSPAIGAAQTDENQTLKSMISDLEKKIEDADKRMIAHPTFLEELRALVENYRSRLRERFFKDTFEDGEYDTNPEWTVRSGTFTIPEAGRLTSFVALSAQPAPEEQAREQTPEAQAVGILLDSIFGAPKKEPAQAKTSSEQAEPVQPASIYTQVVFPPAFEMKMRFKASEQGRMDIILLGSDTLFPRYRLKIQADHSESDPMEIEREGRSRRFVVGAGDKFPAINDGQWHTLSWIRYTDGAMTVLIDEAVVLETYEAYYRDNFTGFEVVNNGGSFEWRSFEVYKSLPPGIK